MEYTTYNTENYIPLLQSSFKIFSMFQMHFWYDKEDIEETFVENISTRFINGGKDTGLSTKI